MRLFWHGGKTTKALVAPLRLRALLLRRLAFFALNTTPCLSRLQPVSIYFRIRGRKARSSSASGCTMGSLSISIIPQRRRSQQRFSCHTASLHKRVYPALKRYNLLGSLAAEVLHPYVRKIW
jgi:hypothetical protein